MPPNPHADAAPPRPGDAAGPGPRPRRVVVCDVHGVAWLVLDAVPGRPDGSAGVSWATPPAPAATGRVFVATLGGRKAVRVLDRHTCDPWDDVRLPVLRVQLDDAYAPPPGWAARHAHRNPVRSDLRYP